MRHKILMSAATTAVAAGLLSGSAGAKSYESTSPAGSSQGAGVTNMRLTPSTPQLAACMPGARVKVTVKSTTEALGFDRFKVHARNLPPKTAFTVFLLETAGPPFGAAEYIGDFTTNKYGNANNEFRAIVDEAFTSTVVNGQRTRVDLNQVGMWFADQKDDDFCLGPQGAPLVTPFDGDNEAGIQAFNSANTQALPAP